MEQQKSRMTDRDIKLFMMFGQTIKFTKLEDGKIAICSDGIFQALFKENKYRHQGRIREMSVDAEYKEGNKNYDFFSLQKYERYFLDYKVQTAAYKKSIEEADGRYSNYVSFIEKGGVNWLYKMASHELGEEVELEFKNIDRAYLTKIEERANIKPIEEIEEEEQEQEEKPKLEPEPELKPEPEKKALEPKPEKSWLRKKLTNRDVYLWSTVLLVFCLMPFTFMALLKYISIDDEGWRLYLSYAMTAGLSIAFDWSILVFTINGKKTLANIGSVFQIVFISVHFSLLGDAIGEEAQSYITKTFAVIYAAILINQLAELSTREDEGN